jgi:NADP-dependent 3-hydroxy acid dehydrogenase YdfG
MGTSNIADKVVVITGASSGLGESTAKLLARHGAKVVLGARRKDRIDAVVKEISAAGGYRQFQNPSYLNAAIQNQAEASLRA